MSRGARRGVGTTGLTALALALSVVESLGIVACSEHGQRPNVLLIVADTVRADRVSSYGYERHTTPNIDALARDGIRFANASSTSTWTLPSHASLFTGVMPIRHKATQENRKLGDEFATLAELLSDAGYATIGVSANPIVSRATGLARGFEAFELTSDAPSPGVVGAHPNIEAVRGFLGTRVAEQPFFAFVNFIEAHGPYEPPEPWRSRFLARGRNVRVTSYLNVGGAAAYYGHPVRGGGAAFADLNDLYDGEVAYVDALVGELLRELERTGVAEDTVVVMTSDHGENIGDHGHFRHVFSLYASTVRIPLIIRVPGSGRAGEVRTEAVSLAEIFPTILRMAGVDRPAEQAVGRDLLDSGALDAQPVFAEYYYPVQALASLDRKTEPTRSARVRQFLRRLRSVELAGFRMVWSSAGDRELYDLERDPAELEDLSRTERYAQQRKELEARLAEYVLAAGDEPLPLQAEVAEAPEDMFGELDDASRERLRALGYLR